MIRLTAAWTTPWRRGNARAVTCVRCCGPYFTAPTSGRRRTCAPRQRPRSSSWSVRRGRSPPSPTRLPVWRRWWRASASRFISTSLPTGILNGKLPGVTVVLDSIVSAGDAEQLIGVVNEKILGGTMSENTKQVLRRELAGVGDPAQARALAVGLAIGGPEFQRQ